MTIKVAEIDFVKSLVSVYNREEARAIFYLCLEQFSDPAVSKRTFNKEQVLTEMQQKCLENILTELKSGKPVQYILGEADFFGLKFKVNPAVLIPRPETEELVDWIIRIGKKEDAGLNNHGREPFRVLDIGTGSGCIPVALKKKVPQWLVSAIDISAEAIGLAKANAGLNEVEVDFYEADVFNLPEWMRNTKYSVIVSNPPYITHREQEKMHQNVLAHEPHLALFVPDENPLLFYKAIADFAKSNLQAPGFLFFEINAALGKETVDMLVSKEFIDIELRKDMQGNDRMILART